MKTILGCLALAVSVVACASTDPLPEEKSSTESHELNGEDACTSCIRKNGLSDLCDAPCYESYVAEQPRTCQECIAKTHDSARCPDLCGHEYPSVGGESMTCDECKGVYGGMISCQRVCAVATCEECKQKYGGGYACAAECDE